MRYFLISVSLVFFFSGCLKNDILDDDLVPANFQETSYYQEGQFESEAKIEVQELEITSFVNAQGTLSCRGELQLGLPQEFRDNIAGYWSHEIRITFIYPPPSSNVDYSLQPPYSLQISKKVSSLCGDTASVPYRLSLISPASGHIVASVEKDLEIHLEP